MTQELFSLSPFRSARIYKLKSFNILPQDGTRRSKRTHYAENRNAEG